MELPAYMPDVPPVLNRPELPAPSEEFEFDLDRVVYDPSYRQWVMDQMKRRNSDKR